MKNFFENTEKAVLAAFENRAFPSCIIAVGDADGVYYKKAFGYERVLPDDTEPDGVFCGDIPDDAPKAGFDTLYDMASLSKLISTTMVTLRLLDIGEITLPDTVSRVFPDAPDDKKNISILQLLTHSSGISAHFSLYRESECPEKALDVILNRPLAYSPSTQAVYSCMGFILLGEMLQKMTGEKLDVLAQKLVFDPLGMSRTGYLPMTNERLKGMSVATTEYSKDLGKYVHGVVHDENARYIGGVSGNAGVFSCIDDMIIFARMLSRRGEHDGEYFLTPATFETAIKNYTPYGPEYRGLGFYLSVDSASTTGDLFAPLSYGHTGFTGTSLYVDRDTGMYTVMLTNRVHYTRANDKLFRFRRQMHNVTLADYLRMKKSLS